MNVQKQKRTFLPESFAITDWESLKTYWDNLTDRNISSLADLQKWLKDKSELESVVSEEFGWRYIRMTCQTDDETLLKAYQYFVQEIQPNMAPYADKLNKKLIESPFLPALEKEEGMSVLIRQVKKELDLFREQNIPLFTEIETLAQQYAQWNGAMTITWKDQELTLPQAAALLQETDRTVRQQVWEKTTARRLQDQEKLDELFSTLIAKRHQVALNAGFANYRDYMFASLGRFDYTPADCFRFHDAIEKEIKPLLNKLASERKKKLNVDTLRPWDKAVDAEGRAPLKPFDNGQELIQKTIACLSRVDTKLGKCLQYMNEIGRLDVESRKAKAPGGYNYPLYETGVPFIFMNASSLMRDVTTLLHESGHAVHNFLTHELPLVEYKSPPMEVAEVASMTMELITMDAWDVYFKNANDNRRAKEEHLEDVLETLPWIATIDAFQHWLYENPTHSVDERKAMWRKIYKRFSDDVTDWSGYDKALDYVWQKQLHLYEVPFYYIEYGMAQLGAIALWKNYTQNKQAGLENYYALLTCGNKKTIPEIYASGNIAFDFSQKNIRELLKFVEAYKAKLS